MKMNIAVRLLQTLPVRAESAMTVSQIQEKLFDSLEDGNVKRNIQRYVSELSYNDPDGDPALIDVIEGNPRRYFLKSSGVAAWCMTEQVALNILLTRHVLRHSLGAAAQMDTDTITSLAEQAILGSPQTKRIQDRIRVVQDSIGRLPARIKPAILQAAIDAIAKQRQLRFDYESSAGKPSENLVSPQGLAAKDGTIYLLGTQSFSDKPRHFPLHRMTKAEVDHRPVLAQPEFDLDNYIQDSHQLSHSLEPSVGPISLRLRVAPEALYHFNERPLSNSQIIEAQTDSNGWYFVTNQIPDTFLLAPFLLSMGGWIEVVSPQSVRVEVAKRLKAAASHYL